MTGVATTAAPFQSASQAVEQPREVTAALRSVMELGDNSGAAQALSLIRANTVCGEHFVGMLTE